MEIGKTKLIAWPVQKAFDDGCAATDILQAMVDTMGVVGDKFSAGQMVVP